MATVDETIRTKIVSFPSLHTNRTQALHHILCSIGGGYEWRNGEAVVAYPASYVPWDERAHRDETANRVRQFSPALREAALLGDEEEIAILSQVVATVDERVHLVDEGSIFPYDQTKYALLMNIPDDVTEDWLAACEEMKALMSKHGWVF